MRRVLARQSELSLATAVFFAAGGLFSVLSLTAFSTSEPPRNPYTLLAVFVAFPLAVIVLLRGDRLRPLTAGALMSATAALLLVFASSAATGYRAIHIGLLFVTIFIFFIWFMPRWIARVVGWSWMTLYAVGVVMRFDGEVLLPLMSLIATTLIVGELIGRFKDGLEAQSLTDPLCGVWNRRGFGILLDRAVTDAARSGTPLSVLYLDLDGFKRVNDERGHEEGDRVLIRFARAVDEESRPQDVVARLGGDEFVLLLPAATEVDARAVMRRLVERITHVGWTCGVAQLQAGEDAAAFISRADELMLALKRASRSDASE